MALPDFLKYEVGTAKAWKSTGGDYTLTLTSLTNNSGREGGKGDLGANRARLWRAYFSSSVGSAATSGNEIELYWASSRSATAGTDNPGSLTGADAGVTNPDQVKYQLIFLGSLILSNGLGTGIQKQAFVFSPPDRYGFPVVVNKSGQTLGSTAGDHEVAVTPMEEGVEDTA